MVNKRMQISELPSGVTSEDSTSSEPKVPNRSHERMARGLTFLNFLKELGMRVAAAAVVLGIFFGLGYANRVNFLGLSSLLGNQGNFFGAAFLLVGLVSLGWIVVQRYRR